MVGAHPAKHARAYATITARHPDQPTLAPGLAQPGPQCHVTSRLRGRLIAEAARGSLEDCDGARGDEGDPAGRRGHRHVRQHPDVVGEFTVECDATAQQDAHRTTTVDESQPTSLRQEDLVGLIDEVGIGIGLHDRFGLGPQPQGIHPGSIPRSVREVTGEMRTCGRMFGRPQRGAYPTQVTAEHRRQ